MTPQSQRAAARRRAEERARRAVAELGGDVPPIADPFTEFISLLGRARAVEDALWSRLARYDLRPGDLDASRVAL